MTTCFIIALQLPAFHQSHTFISVGYRPYNPHLLNLCSLSCLNYIYMCSHWVLSMNAQLSFFLAVSCSTSCVSCSTSCVECVPLAPLEGYHAASPLNTLWISYTPQLTARAALSITYFWTVLQFHGVMICWALDRVRTAARCIMLAHFLGGKYLDFGTRLLLWSCNPILIRVRYGVIGVVGSYATAIAN